MAPAAACTVALRAIAVSNQTTKHSEMQTAQLSIPPSVPNPWAEISWEKTVAPGDQEILDRLNARRSKDCGAAAPCAILKKKLIDTSLLPEPYTGRIDSKVVLLNLNPGLNDCDRCFRGNGTLLAETQATLRQEPGKPCAHHMWLHTDIRCADGGLHGGCRWWRQKTHALWQAVRKVRGEAAGGKADRMAPQELDIFVLEYFPYHSEHAMDFPPLPSDSYRNHLLRHILRETQKDKDRLVVIMRSKEEWRSIGDPEIQEGFRAIEEAGQLIVLTNQRNPTVSPGNIGKDAHVRQEAWQKLVKTLSVPLPVPASGS